MAAHPLGYLPHQRQSDPRSFEGFVGTLEHLKEARPKKFGDANPFVLAPDSHEAVPGLGSNSHLRNRARLYEFNGIVEQIGKALGQSTDRR